VQIAVPRWAGIALAVFGLAMLGALIMQIVLLDRQLGTVRDQRAIADRQAERAQPVLRDVRPLVRDVRLARPWLLQAAPRLDRLTRAAAPLAEELTAARAGDAARATIALADDLLDADVGRATRSVVRIADVAGDLQTMLRETRQRDLLRRVALAADAVPELERVSRRSLRIQRRTLKILEQSLAIQRSTQQHAASLDRKTGGSPPALP
jgi:hypothetical protein